MQKQWWYAGFPLLKHKEQNIIIQLAANKMGLNKTKKCADMTYGAVKYEGRVIALYNADFMNFISVHLLCKTYIMHCALCVLFTTNKHLELSENILDILQNLMIHSSSNPSVKRMLLIQTCQTCVSVKIDSKKNPTFCPRKFIWSISEVCIQILILT